MPDNTAAAPPHPWRDITVKHVTRVLNDLEREGGSTLIVPLWPIIIGLMERNCLPGNELHPAVRTLYARFLALVADEPDDNITDARYAAWLAGDITVSSAIRNEFAARWEQSRSDTTDTSNGMG